MVNYVVTLILCGLSTIATGLLLINAIRKIIKGTAENEDKLTLVTMIVPMLLISTAFVAYCIDIPSALKGGETVYTNELPETTYAMHSWHTISDNPELKHLQGCRFDKYEKYGNYRIRYTKLNRLVLEIEKLD